jgi:hypothetical protein
MIRPLDSRVRGNERIPMNGELLQRVIPKPSEFTSEFKSYFVL